MKNKKFLKAIATLTIGAVASVGCFAVAACSSCDDTAEEHQHNYTWTPNDDGETHNGHCDVDGCDEPDVTNQAHVYTDDNDKDCNVCGYEREIGGGGDDEPGGDNPGGVHKHNYTWTPNSDGTTHNGHCDVDGCDAPDVTNEDHVYDDENDATCNKCGATRDIGGGDTPVVKSAYDVLAERSDNIIAENFATTATADIKVHSGTYGNKGVYVNNDGVYAVTDGALIVGDKATSTSNIEAVVDFGVVSGKVEGYFELTMNDASSSGNFNSVKFVNHGNTVLQLMAVSGGNFAVTLNGSPATVENEVASAKDTLYKVEFTFDLTNKKLTLKINGTAVLTDADSNIDAITGLTVATSNSGKRSNTIDNIAVCGTAVSLADYQADLAGKLDAKKAVMTGEGGTHTSETSKAAVEEVLTAGKAAVNAAETHADAYVAYNNAVKALNLVAGDAYEDVVDYIHSQYNPANYTNPDAKKIYDAQVAIILAETDLTKLAIAGDGVEEGATLTAVKAALADMVNDADAYEAEFNKAGEEFMAEYNPVDYRLNDRYGELMESAEISDTLGENTYAQAIAALNAGIAKLRADVAELDDDDAIISATAQTMLADFNTAVAAELAKVDNPSADLVAAVDALKPSLDDLIENIRDEEGNYADINNEHYVYEITIAGKLQTALDAIKEEIENVGTPVEEARTKAAEAYAKYKTDVLATVKDSAYAEVLAADSSAPALDVSGCANSSAVTVKLNETKAEFDNWVEEKLKAKTYNVTINDVKVNGLTVKYGETLNAADVNIDPTADNPNLMIDPADANLYDANDDKYDFATLVYGDIVLHYNTVEAVTITPESEDPHSFSYANLATPYGLDKNKPEYVAANPDAGIEMVYGGDKSPLLSGVMKGDGNGFLTIVGKADGELSENVTWRKSNSCIENKDAGLQLTLTDHGTITIKFASTGGDNVSRLGLLDKDGNWVVASNIGKGISNTPAESYSYTTSKGEVTVLGIPAEVGSYEMKGTSVVTIVFTVDAGTYTISCPSAGTGRGARIMGIDTKYTPYKVQKIDAESVVVSGENINHDDVNAIAIDGSVQLVATTDPAVVTNKVVWSSSNDAVATVDATGMVKAVAQGKVTITATIDGKTDTITFDVGGFATYLQDQITVVTNNTGDGVLEENKAKFATVKENALTELNAATSKTAVDEIVAEFNAEVAKLASKVYNVTLHYGDTEVDTSITVKEGETLAQPTDSKYKQAKPGYKLVGWYSDEIFETAYTFGSEVSAAVELWAKYEAVTVTFKDGDTTLDITATITDGKLIAPENPTKEGFTFVEWKLGDAAYDGFDKEIFDDVTLIASWQSAKISYLNPEITGGSNSKLSFNDEDNLITLSSETTYLKNSSSDHSTCMTALKGNEDITKVLGEDFKGVILSGNTKVDTAVFTVTAKTKAVKVTIYVVSCVKAGNQTIASTLTWGTGDSEKVTFAANSNAATLAKIEISLNAEEAKTFNFKPDNNSRFGILRLEVKEA